MRCVSYSTKCLNHPVAAQFALTVLLPASSLDALSELRSMAYIK